MVMGDRITPGAVQAVGNVKETVDTATGDRSPEADTRTGQVTADVKQAGDTAGAAAGDVRSP